MGIGRPGGHGHIDVALERGGCSVACEVCVTTRVAHEVQNLTKCLAAGFDYAVLVCSNGRTLNAARSALVGADPERLRFVLPDGLIARLDELAAPAELPEDAETPVAQGVGDRPPKDLPVSPEARKRLLTAKDAASYIGLANQTLAKMRVTGDSPPFYKVGRQVLYDRAGTPGSPSGGGALLRILAAVTLDRHHAAPHCESMTSRTVHGGEWIKISPVNTKQRVSPRCDRCYRAAMTPKMVSIKTDETLCIPCWAHRVGAELYWEVTGKRTLPKLPKEYRRFAGSRPTAFGWKAWKSGA